MNPNNEKQEIRGRTPDEKAGNNKEPPKPLSTKQLAISLLIKIAAIVLAAWLIFAFVLGIAINYGNNMHPQRRRSGDFAEASASVSQRCGFVQARRQDPNGQGRRTSGQCH